MCIRDRDELLSKADFNNEIVPLLKKDIHDKQTFIGLTKNEKEEALPYIDEKLRNYLSLRKIVSVIQKHSYKRS